MKQKIKDLLKSKNKSNWFLAIQNHKEGGYSAEDAYRWLLYGLFSSAELDSGRNCGSIYYSYWCGGDEAFLILEFGGVSLTMIYDAVADMETVHSDSYTSIVTILDGGVKRKSIKIKDLGFYTDYIPKRRPYVDYEGVEGDCQAYFYGLMCHLLRPYKQQIIRQLEIDVSYLDPILVNKYERTLFPIK